VEDTAINRVTDDRNAHYEPFGWHHWPEYPWMSYQFRRALGETQEGGGAISECFQAASRMVPGDQESWHVEWTRVAERNRIRGDEAEAAGHINTAMTCWLRAVDYYRQAEFWLLPDDPRRLETFTKCEGCFQKAIAYFVVPGETVQIPYEEGSHLYGYFLRAPFDIEKQPVIISFGGLDSFKEELLYMVGNGMLARGISCLLVDGPGQGGTLRREGIASRFDYEVPVGRCIDYLETRDDVDLSRIAVSGTSLGGYYAARAASKEHRLAAAISHGAIWSVADLWGGAVEEHGLAHHIK
jgi:FrsA-like alpha/beta hydrolase family protein